ncbi:DUF5696 domain-containing protein [Paenibacillus sp. GCM10027626]|uniref:DUF5696 domain-containing protein n=1 Tax=Paenibacillus sp. GCM10027626 TaxID=3273411 RepID=UPI00362DE17B
MSNVKKAAGIAVIAALLFAGLSSWVVGEEWQPDRSERLKAGAEDREIEYKINRFTAPEPEQTAKIASRAIPADYKLVARSDNLELYADRQLQGLMIKNRQSGYVWSSVPEEAVLQSEKLNEEWGSALRSPFLIDYFDASAIKKRGNYRGLDGSTVRVEQLPEGIRAVYELKRLDITFAIEVKLERDELVIRIPDADIAENGGFKLAAIQPFPFFGAVRSGDIPGYMLIPDGSGALVRFQAKHPRYDQGYTAKIYGMDYAAEYSELWTVNEQPVMMPVFGMVHGARQNSFIGIVEDGKYSAAITASPGGVNTNFYWTSPQFVLRHAYFQATSKNMGGFNSFQAERIRGDLQVRYLFQQDEAADYVGMAKAYRSYLLEREMLTPKAAASGDMPLQLQVLGLEKEPGQLGSKMIKMTSFEEAEEIVRDLRQKGVRNLAVIYSGWGTGGMSGSSPDVFPAAAELGGSKGLKRLQEKLKVDGIPLYLYADYTNAYGSNGNFRPKADGIRTIDNKVMSDKRYLWLDEESSGDLDIYFMNPSVAAKIAAKDAKRFKDLGAEALAIGTSGWMLLSDYHPDHPLTRAQAAGEYAKLADGLLGTVGKLAFYRPNDYLWKYSPQMFDTPLYSSQYMFATDTVPFLQIALHGYIDYFAPAANYNANPQEYLLRMAEYGAYPSFIVANEPSWKLKNTLSNYLFTSYYRDWSEEIASTYTKLNEALKQVQDAAIERRTVLDWGVVEVVYSNGIKIVVNYRQKDIAYENRTVPKMDFIVTGGE